MKLKICGLKYPENIEAIMAMKLQYMGFIFYEGSKRYVGKDFDKNIILNIKKEGIEPVMVTVNMPLKDIINFAQLYHFTTLQLHGSESPEYCQTLKEKGFIIIKAFGINEAFDFESLKAYVPYIDYFLFDTASALHGGTGLKFNYDLLKAYKEHIPVFLSGGISAGDIENIGKQMPKSFPLYAIDANSKLEIEPGLKDIYEVKNIIQNIKNEYPN